MSFKIGNYAYNRISSIQNITIFANIWSTPSLIQSLAIENTSSLIHPTRSIFYNKTIVVEVNFPHPVFIRAALEDLPFELMPLTISDTPQTYVKTNITLPPGTTGHQTLYIRSAYDDGSPAPYAKAVTFQVEEAPTGTEAAKLLRLGKYSYDGGMRRWDSVTSAPLPDDYFSFNWMTKAILSYLPHAPKNVIIPKQINKKDVVLIADHAFESKDITSVLFLGNINEIGNFAFANNLLETLHLPAELSKIKTYAFLNNQISAITIPNNVTSISQGAFENNPITAITIGDNVTIANETAMGTFGASFSSVYTLYGKMAGTYLYENDAWTLVGSSGVPVPISINITTPPTKTVYQVGESLDTTGLTVEALMSNDIILELDTQDLIITGFDSSAAAASQTITVSYNGLTNSFNIVIEAITLVAMNLISPPNQLVYFVGDYSLALTGLVVELQYSDDNVATLDHNTIAMLANSGEFFITGFDSSVPVVSQTITLSYSELSTTFNIELVNSPLFSFDEHTDYIEITGYTGTDPDIVIPATINGKPITRIKNNAFTNLPLTSAIMPATVVFIGDNAFQGTQLTGVQIPDSVFSIGLSAFNGCQLTHLVIPDSVTYIGNEAFANNNIATLSLGTGLTSLNYGSIFQNNQLISVIIPNNITSIGMSVFANNNIRNLILSSNLTMIGEDAFAANQIENLALPNSLVMLGSRAFSYNKITNLSLPTALTTILPSVFEENLLTDVTIPNNITSIRDDAFKNNPITEITIGENVTIGNTAPENVMGTYGQSFNVAYTENSKTEGIYNYIQIDSSWTYDIIPTPPTDFFFDSSTGTITGLDSNASKIVIPSSINGVPVTGIADNAFTAKPISVTIASLPNKTTYVQGENNLNLDGLVVEATYDDASVDVLDPVEFTVSGFNTDNITTAQTITIEYHSFTTTFDIAIVAN